MARRVGDVAVELVHVPDARVGRPRVGRRHRRLARAVVVHEEDRVLHQRGNLHPDARLAVRVPRLDLVREHVALGVREANVSAARRALGVVEALGRVLRETHEHRIIGQCLRARIARHCEAHGALEVAELDRRRLLARRRRRERNLLHRLGALVVRQPDRRDVVRRREQLLELVLPRRSFRKVLGDGHVLAEVRGVRADGDRHRAALRVRADSRHQAGQLGRLGLRLHLDRNARRIRQLQLLDGRGDGRRRGRHRVVLGLDLRCRHRPLREAHLVDPAAPRGVADLAVGDVAGVAERQRAVVVPAGHDGRRVDESAVRVDVARRAVEREGEIPPVRRHARGRRHDGARGSRRAAHVHRHGRHLVAADLDREGVHVVARVARSGALVEEVVVVVLGVVVLEPAGDGEVLAAVNRAVLAGIEHEHAARIVVAGLRPAVVHAEALADRAGLIGE